MIQSQDRSYYIGASDTSMVVGNWATKTFEKWWLEKLGLNKNDLKTEAMQTVQQSQETGVSAMKDTLLMVQDIQSFQSKIRIIIFNAIRLIINDKVFTPA